MWAPRIPEVEPDLELLLAGPQPSLTVEKACSAVLMDALEGKEHDDLFIMRETVKAVDRFNRAKRDVTILASRFVR
jgi:hypothetical protein